MKWTFIIFFLFSSHNAYSLVENVDKIKKKDKKFLSQVNVSPESKTLMDQFLKKNEGYNGKDSYSLNFICDKKSNKTKCELNQYKVLKKMGR